MNKLEDRYRVFFEASTDGMLTIEDGRFVDCNEASLEMLGFSSREELFQTHPGEISPETQPDGRNSFEKAEELIAKAMQEGSCRFDWIHTNKDGNTFPVEVLLIRVPDGEKTVLNVVWRDISDRFALEEALMEARLLNEAVQQSGASTIITDPEGKIEYINPAFTQINGYTLDEVMGQTPNILNSGLQPEEFYEEMWDIISSGQVWSGTLKNMRKNGELYWARLKISPVKDALGTIHHYIGIETDISDFIEAKEKAEQANKAKSDFLSSMSHELRTPLNSILGFSQLLEMNGPKNLNENQLKQVAQIHKAGEHLLGLIDEVLDLAKVEAGKLNYQIEDVDVRTILDECIAIVSSSYNELNVTLFDTAPRQLPKVYADNMRMKQAILNLISNAKKYNRPNGEVIIKVEDGQKGYLYISVTDTGEGISEANQEKMFEPFNRLGAENSGIEGTGIGLLLTRKMVEEMGGHFGFESKLGVGSRFWMSFPISKRAKKISQQRKVSAEDLRVPCCDEVHTLLYVEDNPLNREVMKGYVEQVPNLDLVVADNALQGLELAQQLKPHMILLDINLPDKDGFEVFCELKKGEETRDIPIVALSADAMEATKEKAKDLGFNGYLTKPFRLIDMKEVLNRFIVD